MKVYRELTNFSVEKPIVTIGTYDGVHLGHQTVIRNLKEIAEDEQGSSVILTFYPHPRIVTSPNEKNLRLLTTIDEKIVRMEDLGLDHLIVQKFDYPFSQLSYNQFIKQYLVEKIKLHTLVIGYDHRFGKNREGSFENLGKIAKQYGFNIKRLDAYSIDEVNISSSKIRKALQDGQIEHANRLLGYNFTLKGKVVKGKELGRTIGFPTANIEASDVHKIIPGYGVYAVRIKIGSITFNGMLNVGTRPTFNNNADNRSIEVNIFDFDEVIYNQEIELTFIKKTRDEQKFASIEELKNQLAKDKQQISEILKKV